MYFSSVRVLLPQLWFIDEDALGMCIHKKTRRNGVWASFTWPRREQAFVDSVKQTADANTRSLSTVREREREGERERESTPHYSNKDNKYLFIRSASSGCLLTSLHTLLININVRPIYALGERARERERERKQEREGEREGERRTQLLIRRWSRGSWMDLDSESSTPAHPRSI